MKGRIALLVVVGVAIASVLGVTPGIADGGGGTFVDMDPSHPAYQAVKDLVARGVITVGAGGTFQGSAPLLRYDAAQWIYRAIKNVETTGGTGLSSQVQALDARVQSLAGQVSNQGADIQALRTSVSTLSRDVQALQAQPSGALAGRVQTNFILGVTGVLLGAAALAMFFFW
jgi:hypothetical protein